MEVIIICLAIAMCSFLLSLFCVLLETTFGYDWISKYVIPILFSTAIISMIIVIFISITQALKSELSVCDTCYRVKIERYERTPI